MTLKLSYAGKLQTPDIIKDLFYTMPAQQLQLLMNDISPTLYGFIIDYNNTQSIVYRTHDEIVRFLRIYNKKAKEQKYPHLYDFDKIRDAECLKYINGLREVQNEEWFREFFDIGTIIPGKKFSMQLKKQSGGRYAQYKCCLCIRWKRCQVYILNTGVITYDNSKQKIQQFLHFCKDFSWQVPTNPSSSSTYQIYINSYHRKLTLQAQNASQFFIFIYNLQKYFKIYKKQQMQYRFNSFAPVRYQNNVQFFVDGAEYFQAVAHGIQSAEQQVFICGWWISPQFHLIRPVSGTNIDYRFDNLLARTAKNNVKIYIVVYYQSSFLTNDSQYTIKALQSLNSNIKVLRHPQIVLPTFWSHHQKLIIIDQSLAFLGGLDLCYGRYDTPQHLITQSSVQLYPGIQYNNCRIADFINVRQYKIQNIKRTLPRLPWHDVALMIKGNCVKDLTRHFIQYWNYASYQTHFADRYVLITNEKDKQVIIEKKNGLFDSIKDVMNQIRTKFQKRQSRRSIDNNKPLQIQIDKITQQISENKVVSHKKIPKSSSFVNAFNKIFQINDKNKPQKQLTSHIMQQKQKQIYEKSKKQSPSSQLMYLQTQNKDQTIRKSVNIQEIDLNFGSEQSTGRKSKKQFMLYQTQQMKQQRKQIQRIKWTQNRMKQTLIKIQQMEDQIDRKQHIQEAAQNDYLQQRTKKIEIIQPPHRISHDFLSKAKQSFIQKFGPRKQKKLTRSTLPVNHNYNIQHKMQQIQLPISQTYTCQALRSASQWSIGSKQYEKSIYDGYLSLINKAQKYIYIQNQFFISATHQNGVVKNKIMQAISDRIMRAIQMKEKFRVIIIMPLIPGFAGQLDDPAASLPRVIMSWQYKTICRGEESLLGRISKKTNNPWDYIQILGLRTHGIVNQIPTTQIIYLHSKLMIIDDRYLICGSANINDRSMQGNRDSQLCILVEGSPNTQIFIDKQSYFVVEKIHKLRLRLWAEHFGISQFKARNPMSDELWKQISTITKNNTMIYKKIFGSYPDDEIKNLLDIKKFRKAQLKIQEYNQQYYKIQGHAVLFPLTFLQNQKMTSYHPHAIST